MSTRDLFFRNPVPKGEPNLFKGSGQEETQLEDGEVFIGSNPAINPSVDSEIAEMQTGNLYSTGVNPLTASGEFMPYGLTKIQFEQANFAWRSDPNLIVLGNTGVDEDSGIDPGATRTGSPQVLKMVDAAWRHHDATIERGSPHWDTALNGEECLRVSGAENMYWGINSGADPWFADPVRNGVFSIFIRFNVTTDPGASVAMLLDTANVTNGWQIFLRGSTNGVATNAISTDIFVGGTSEINIDAGSEWSLNTWYTIALVGDGTTVSLYKDNMATPIGTDTYSSTPNNTNVMDNDMLLGGAAESPTSFPFGGGIAGVVYVDEALSQGDLEAWKSWIEDGQLEF